MAEVNNDSLREWLKSWGDGPNWSDPTGQTVPIAKATLEAMLNDLETVTLERDNATLRAVGKTEESLLEAGYVPAERVRAWDQQAIVTALLASPELRMSTMLAMPDKSMAVEERRQREAAETRARDAETHLAKIAQLAEATAACVREYFSVDHQFARSQELRNNAGYLLAAVAAWRAKGGKEISCLSTQSSKSQNSVASEPGETAGCATPGSTSFALGSGGTRTAPGDGGADKATHTCGGLALSFDCLGCFPAPTHVEAREIAQRYIDCAFRNEGRERPRHSIPVRMDHDDDVRLTRYIDRQEQCERERDAAESRAEELRKQNIDQGEQITRLYLQWANAERPYRQRAHAQRTELNRLNRTLTALRAESAALETKLAEQDLVNQRTRAENERLRKQLAGADYGRAQQPGGDLEPKCWCARCEPYPNIGGLMIVCPKCGNKPYPDALRNNAGYLLAAVAAWRAGKDSGPIRVAMNAALMALFVWLLLIEVRFR